MTSTGVRRPLRTVVASLLLSTACRLTAQWAPPEVATTRKAFEAAYPKATVSDAALEIEALAAHLGIDIARRNEQRENSELASAEAARRAVAAAAEYVRHELEEPGDRIALPGDAVAKFMEANASTIDSIVAIASGRRQVVWDLDVSAGVEAPVPNGLALSNLQRVLSARALIEIRDGKTDAALTTIESMWRLCESLAARPELISHLVVISQARLVVGLLRKVDGPAFGWPERLREGAFFEAFLAAFQNDPWPAADDPEMAENVRTLTRIYRRFADDLIAQSACEWTREELARSWDVAVSGESDPNQMIMTIASESIINMVLRSHRSLLDAELTALILDARIDKYASREGAWPARLPNLESSVCPGRFYTYRRSGGVTLAFEGSAPSPSGDERGLVLSLTFRGAPPPTPTRTPKQASTPTPVAPLSDAVLTARKPGSTPPLLTPTPEGGMISPR